MTVFIYASTSKQIGDKDHIKMFANVDAAKRGSRRTILKAWHSSTRCWNKPPRLSDLRSSAARPTGARPRAPDSASVLHFGYPRFCLRAISSVSLAEAAYGRRIFKRQT
jgi:hypothetical protein